MRNHIVAFVALAAVLVATSAVAQGRIEPGEWEKSTSTDVPGLNSGPVQDTRRECYTTADQKIYADKDAWAADMIAATTDTKCKATNLKQEGTALSVTLACDDDTRIELHHDFHGTTGTMDAQMWIREKAGAKTHIELKRVAEQCSPETIASWKRWHKGEEFVP